MHAGSQRSRWPPAIRASIRRKSVCIAQCCACMAATLRSVSRSHRNSSERTRVSNVKVADGELTAFFPGYENWLRATLHRNSLEGETSKALLLLEQQHDRVSGSEDADRRSPLPRRPDAAATSCSFRRSRAGSPICIG
jgi:hypothetical protein